MESVGIVRRMRRREVSVVRHRRKLCDLTDVTSVVEPIRRMEGAVSQIGAREPAPEIYARPREDHVQSARMIFERAVREPGFDQVYHLIETHDTTRIWRAYVCRPIGCVFHA